MTGLLQRMLGKLLMSALGLGLWLAYMTFFGGAGSSGPVLSSLPEAVFGGGGGELGVHVALSQPGRMTAVFERHAEDADGETVEAVVELSPGIHRTSVDVADATYGYLEVSIPDATPGAILEWTVDLDGEVLTNEEIVLDQPLEDGYAFFVQLEFDEIEELRSYASR